MEVPKPAEGQPAGSKGWVDNFYSRQYLPQSPAEPVSPTLEEINQVDEVRVQTTNKRVAPVLIHKREPSLVFFSMISFLGSHVCPKN